MLKRTLLWIILAGGLVGADPLSPPEGARLVGSEPTVKLSWEGSGKEYYLQVMAAGRALFEGPVQGNSHTLKLRPNVYYTWSVTPGGAGGYRGQAETHHFQHSSQLEYNWDGRPGQSGLAVAPQPGVSGASGGPGEPGQDLHIYLNPAGDYVAVKMEGARQKVEFLFMPSSAPLAVTARGGSGGEGGVGGDGANAYVMQNSYNSNYIVPATAGGPGGRGGNGGNGGRVTIHNRLPPGAPQVLRVNVSGGQPGPGGPGGRGGSQLPAGYVGNTTYPYLNPNYPGNNGAPAQSGSKGADGRAGAEGSISETP